MKNIFRTKTFWYNLLSGISLFVMLPELRDLLGPDTLKYVVLVNAGINIILRYVTEDPVKPISQSFGGSA